METAKIAKALVGDSLYQQRARAALPILVRQAHAGAKIFYSDLASELGMPNPRNLNYPLGSIGTAITKLSKEWSEEIPLINCLVINKSNTLPGDGIGWFVRDVGEFKSYSPRKKRAIVDGILSRIFAYPRWNEVLAALGLEQVTTNFASAIESAAKYHGGVESPQHKALKKFVAENPDVVGLPDKAGPGEQEYAIPSGDSIDVFFFHESIRTAVEVKSRLSPVADIVRGLYQCIKYRAVLRASVAAEASDDAVDAILVLEDVLPDDLRKLRNTLDITVVESVRVPDAYLLEIVGESG